MTNVYIQRENIVPADSFYLYQLVILLFPQIRSIYSVVKCHIILW